MPASISAGGAFRQAVRRESVAASVRCRRRCAAASRAKIVEVRSSAMKRPRLLGRHAGARPHAVEDDQR